MSAKHRDVYRCSGTKEWAAIGCLALLYLSKIDPTLSLMTSQQRMTIGKVLYSSNKLSSVVKSLVN